jgi:hypothetical protein
MIDKNLDLFRQYNIPEIHNNFCIVLSFTKHIYFVMSYSDLFSTIKILSGDTNMHIEQHIL